LRAFKEGVKKKGNVGYLNYIIQLPWSISMLPKKDAGCDAISALKIF
jgi:hypothetical protein